MKNREKFAKEILDIACKGNRVAVTKSSKIAGCGNIECHECLFDNIHSDISCDVSLERWSESEYIEKPTIISKEKAFLDLLLPEWKYIARDSKDNNMKLYAFTKKPTKGMKFWRIENMSLCDYVNISDSNKLFGNMFDFIKWEDEEPWSVEDLKKLEVKDER